MAVGDTPCAVVLDLHARQHVRRTACACYAFAQAARESPPAARPAPPRSRAARGGSTRARRPDSPARRRRLRRRGRIRSPRRGPAAWRRRSARRAGGPARAAGGLRGRRWRASPMATVAAFDFGAQARYVTPGPAAAGTRAGRRTRRPASPATASGRACGSALPTSSLARITSRRQRNRTSSPASSMRASQYSPASGSLPRMLLIRALAAS